jgi:glycosyltransferase involved in cell wall biosynthesis
VFIVHVLSSFHLGGQERVVLDLATAQRAHGDDVLVVSIAPPPEGPIAAELRAAGVRAETLAKRPSFDPSLPVRLALRLARERVDIVHTHNPQALIYGALAGRLVGARVVHTKHGINPDRTRRLWLRRAAARLVDAYVVVTPALARIATHECDPDRVHVVANGIDMSVFAPRPDVRNASRRELGLPEDAWVVGTVGRLAPEKDQATLVKAVAPLLGEGRYLVIVGDGPERDALHAVIRDANVDRYVRMTGVRSDVARLLSAFDAFALPSRTEGLPLVLLEAMASELPVVASSVGGIPDLVAAGVTGVLVPPSDVPALRAALLMLAGNPAFAHKMGRAARQQVLARHSVDVMAKAYRHLYQAARGRSLVASIGVAPLEPRRADT